MMALGRAGRQPKPASASTTGIDVWVEGHVSEYRSQSAANRSNGHFGVLYLGADYLLTPAILVGALVQFDWTGEHAALGGSSVDGRGYMAGPYASAKLTQHLFFDARIAWGASDNSVNPYGTYADDFSTDRRLAQAKLTGNWRFGNVRITPSVGYTSVEEKQHSYLDTLGILIPSQTTTLQRLSFGPEIAYRLRQAGGTIWEPLLSVHGLWDDTNSRGTIGGFATSNDDLRAMVQVGVLARAPSGLSLRAVASYDGLGSGTGFRDVGGQLWLNMPLQ
jgi:outer membrane autotransporter protein